MPKILILLNGPEGGSRAAKRFAFVFSVAAALGAAAALAKLPPPTPEQQVAAEQAKAKAAYAAKRDAYDLCRAMERVAADYVARLAESGKTVKSTNTPPCHDPGPYVAPAAASGKS